MRRSPAYRTRPLHVEAGGVGIDLLPGDDLALTLRLGERSITLYGRAWGDIQRGLEALRRPPPPVRRKKRRPAR